MAMRRQAWRSIRVAFAGLVATAALAGCKRPPEAVYVDLAAAELPAPAPAPVPAPAAAAVPPAPATFSLAAEPAVAQGQSAVQNSAKVLALIDSNRSATLKRIRARLRDAFLRQADELRRQKLEAFAPEQRAIMQAALDAVGKKYLVYAAAAGPKIAQLAVVAKAFPDPDPKGLRKPRPEDGMAKLTYAIAQRLRAELAKLRADFKAASAAEFKAASDTADERLTALMAGVARATADADGRAQALAEKAVTEAHARLGPLLADSPPLELPALPERSVTVTPDRAGAGRALPPANAAPGPDDRARLEADLKLWLATNRYVLGSKGRARDATEEFKKWRLAFRPARSTPPSPS